MFFSSGFSASKLKPQLKMAVHRFQMSSNKKSALMKQQKKEIASLLEAEPTPKEEKACIRAEALIREDNTIEAYEILQLSCELLSERMKLISSTKGCPPDLVSSISTLMWASNRVDIPELAVIREQFKKKYGKQFDEDAMNNTGGVLNERVFAKLSVQPPSAQLVQAYLLKISEEFEVDWKPQTNIWPEELSSPMSAPIGYSVAVAPGSGLGGASLYDNTSNNSDFSNRGSGGDGSGGMVAAAEQPQYPVVMGLPSAPSFKGDPGTNANIPVAQPYDIPAAPSSQNDYGNTQNKDAYVPPMIPNENDNDDSNTTGGGSTVAGDKGSSIETSYDDLAARFSKLKK